MRLFQSERRLMLEISKMINSDKERRKSVESKAEQEDRDFLVYLPSELQIDEGQLSHFQIRDGSEIVLRI